MGGGLIEKALLSGLFGSFDSVVACGVGLIVGLCQLKAFLESELASGGIVNRWGVETMGGHLLVIPR